MLRRISAVSLIAGLLMPATSFAAMTMPSQVFKALEQGMDPQKYAIEIHGNDGETFAAMWAKGVHQGRTAADFRGDGKLTVDLAMPKADTKLRLRLEYRYLDQTVFLRGGVDMGIEDEKAMLGGNFSTKKWMMFPFPEEMTGGDTMSREDTMDMVAEMLSSEGIHMTGEELDAAIADLMNGIMVLKKSGNEYSIKLKNDAAEDVMQHIAMFGMRLQGMDRADMAAVMKNVDTGDLAKITEIIKGVNLHMRVRVDGKDVPTYQKTYLAMNHMGAEVVMQGTMEKLWTPMTVARPTDVMTEAEFETFFEKFDDFSPWGAMDMMSLPIDDYPSNDVPTEPWGDVPTEDDDWGTPTLWDPCAPGSAQSVQDLRKGGTPCSPTIRSRRHLSR